MFQVKVMGSCRTNNFYDLDAGRKYAEAFSSVLRYLGSESIYAIYTNYESDYKGDFEYLTGIEAKSSIGNVESIFTLPEGEYKCYSIENSTDLPNAVAKTWANVWSDEELSLIERKYEVDYEIYRKDGSFAVFVGIK
ncbi:GyrI-like domain-containing protein [Enterobacter asburiae]|uniref:GyrI-like domain-containing protein n=1 Tax=Enterobacter asburiae TaxID=61645 RepID=UPI002A7FF91E|nr:GyrI-like domain-containing protein [Enterobacter asburiae]